MDLPLPPEAKELGALLWEHGPNRGFLYKAYARCLLAFIAGAGFLGFAVFLSSKKADDPASPLRKDVGVAQAICLVCGLVSMSAGVVRAGMYARRPLQKVMVFQRGLVVVKRDEAFVCPWDQIVEAREFMLVVPSLLLNDHFRHSYRLLWANGRELSLEHKNIGDFERLGDIIQEQLHKVLLPRYLAEFEAGNVLQFDVFRVSLS